MTLITNDYEAFDFVKSHLLTQNAKSIADNTDCLYRGYSQSMLDELKDKADEIVADEEIEWESDKDQVFLDLLVDTQPDSMCAVGCLILDNFYDSDMEGKTIEYNEYIWDAVVKSNPIWKMTENSYHMLRLLQQIHDGEQPDIWEYKLSELNTNFNKYGDYEESI